APPIEAEAEVAHPRRHGVMLAALGASLVVGVVWLASAMLGGPRGGPAPTPAVPPAVATVATPAPTPPTPPTPTPPPPPPPPSALRTAPPGRPPEPLPPEQGAPEPAVERLQTVAQGHFPRQLRSAKLARLSQRQVANGALQQRQTSGRAQPGRPRLNYATVR